MNSSFRVLGKFGAWISYSISATWSRHEGNCWIGFEKKNHSIQSAFTQLSTFHWSNTTWHEKEQSNRWAPISFTVWFCLSSIIRYKRRVQAGNGDLRRPSIPRISRKNADAFLSISNGALYALSDISFLLMHLAIFRRVERTNFTRSEMLSSVETHGLESSSSSNRCISL